ncbi:MAG: type II toxin-antitoxin system RelE/ParE family toxin [Actinomycetota bacterium]
MASKEFRVIVPKNVARELKKLPRSDIARLFGAIESLAYDPQPPGCVKLKTKDLGEYRVRVGPYRIFYDVDDDELTVVIIAAKLRAEDTYKK